MCLSFLPNGDLSICFVVVAADALTGASGIGVKTATSGPHDFRAYVIFPAIPERQLRAAHRPGSSRTDKGPQTKKGRAVAGPPPVVWRSCQIYGRRTVSTT